jgi:hypothetical protein
VNVIVLGKPARKKNPYVSKARTGYTNIFQIRTVPAIAQLGFLIQSRSFRRLVLFFKIQPRLVPVKTSTLFFSFLAIERDMMELAKKTS